MLLYICRLIITSSLMSEEGRKKSISIDDQELFKLFENFVRRYYYIRYRSYVVQKRRIKWATDVEEKHADFLPSLNPDVMLERRDKTLILDTKFYTVQIMSNHHGKKTTDSNNLYQMYAYVKNKADEKEKDGYDPSGVRGLILYAKTEDEEELDLEYSMRGNKIFVKTLDMNDDWDKIEGRLNSFIDFLC